MSLTISTNTAALRAGQHEVNQKSITKVFDRLSERQEVEFAGR